MSPDTGTTLINPLKMKIIDNFLSDEDFKTICNLILTPSRSREQTFCWNYNSNVSHYDEEEHYWKYKYVHTAFEDVQCTTAMNILTPFIEDERLDCKAMKRIIINAYPWTPKVYKHEEHTDYEFPHKGALLNLVTCNGYTFVEGKKVKSVANRVLLFNPSLPHYGTTTSNAKRRVIVNFNYF